MVQSFIPAILNGNPCSLLKGLNTFEVDYKLKTVSMRVVQNTNQY